ncbi:MAG TPA: ATP-binding protein, partial [Thermodesulfobacteriota bacterium]|nr:ATP-binding protein [Thermodesulfobacteriota bacterium]
SIYMMYQLVNFETVTHSILKVDRRMEDLESKLTDSVLSQMRHEKKFMITRDESLYAQYLRAREDFDKSLDEVWTLADSPFQQEQVRKIKEDHQTYIRWIEEESALVRARRPYSEYEQDRKKEQIVDRILENLQRVGLRSRQDTLEKIENLRYSGIQVRQITFSVLAVALVAVLLLSFFITRSITHPIALLVGKTREIARGIFERSEQIPGPPEIRELSDSVNSMCEQLKALDNMKSDFFSTMSHELRTPLTSIKEGTNLLLEGVGGETTERQKKLLKIISGESNRLIALVNSCLDLAKMEAGKMPFTMIPCELMPLIRKAVGEIEPLAMAKKIRLLVAKQEEVLPEVNMDREKILQVLRNYLGNAVKFTPEAGEITISTEREDGRVKVRVKDTGPGIPQESLAGIFEKFQQGPLKKGTGLGLALVKHIVTAHGGRVWAESEPGRGSSFFFVLPV